MSLKDKVRAIPDYPKKGVIFRDVTTLLKEGQDFKEAIDKMAEKIDYEIDKVIGIEFPLFKSLKSSKMSNLLSFKDLRDLKFMTTRYKSSSTFLTKASYSSKYWEIVESISAISRGLISDGAELTASEKLSTSIFAIIGYSEMYLSFKPW